MSPNRILVLPPYVQGVALKRVTRIMAVRNWHSGKIVLLWICGLFPPVALWVFGSRGFRSNLDRQEIAVILIAVLVALVFLVPITWRWFSGKEKKD